MPRSTWLAPALAGLWLAAQAAPALAGPLLGGNECAPCKVPCPPPYIHYYEGVPKLKFKRACPRPVCDPCNLDHYGYYATCWGPWPYDRDFRHCTHPTASDMLPPPKIPHYTPRHQIEPERDPRRDPRREPEAPKNPTPVKPMLPELGVPKIEQSQYAPRPVPIEIVPAPKPQPAVIKISFSR